MPRRVCSRYRSQCFRGGLKPAALECSLPVVVYIIVLVAATLLAILMHGVPGVLIPTGIVLLVATLALVRSTASCRLGTRKTLCALFFSLAAVHIFCGFFSAFLSIWHTSIRSNPDVYFANAFVIDSVGLLAAALGYSWRLNAVDTSGNARLPLLIDADLAEHFFRFFLIAGAVLMFAVYWRLGVQDYLAVPAQWPFLRYITSRTMGGSPADEWFANRAMDLLTVALPFLVYRFAKRRRALNLFLIIVGYLALLLPLRRANLLAVIFGAVILIGIGRHDVYLLTRRWIVIGICLFIFSQCLFLVGTLLSEPTAEGLLTVSSSGLPEVRDLAWTLNLLQGERLNGITFVQGLVPVPSIASEWSVKHGLRAISTRLIGADKDGESGGLRLTLMGEGFINLGYPGAIAASFLWGCGVAWCERLLRSIEKAPSEFMNYIAVMCFVWLFFPIYLAGTEAAATVKSAAILLFFVAWVCRYRPRLAAVPEGAHS
jgi:hypothetical protein